MVKKEPLKPVPNIHMGFDVTNNKPADEPDFIPPSDENVADEIETIMFEDVKVALKNKTTGDTIYYDAKGNKLKDKQIDVLFEAANIPEFSSSGAEKKGELVVREPEYKIHGEEVFHNDEIPELVAERQDYNDGDSWNKTFPKAQYILVKYLRSLQEDGKEKE